jgi:hypothetical protein
MLDEEPRRLDFVAPDQQAFDYWTDGINCLLGKLFIHYCLKKLHLMGITDAHMQNSEQCMQMKGVQILNWSVMFLSWDELLIR